jgi:hypothetical protein
LNALKFDPSHLHAEHGAGESAHDAVRRLRQGRDVGECWAAKGTIERWISRFTGEVAEAGFIGGAGNTHGARGIDQRARIDGRIRVTGVLRRMGELAVRVAELGSWV